MNKRFASALLGGSILVAASGAAGQLTQIFDPSELIGSEFFVENFEDDFFLPGATYSSFSGITRGTADNFAGGVTPSGEWGLSTFSFPDPITVTFAEPVTATGMWFGNDDLCCTTGFTAYLDAYDGGDLIGTVGLEANMNDFADQFLGFNSDVLVTHVTIRFGTGTDVGLFTYIDDVYLTIPAPGASVVIGLGALALRRRTR